MEEERESRPTGHRFWPVVCIHLHSDMWRYMYNVKTMLMGQNKCDRVELCVEL